MKYTFISCLLFLSGLLFAQKTERKSATPIPGPTYLTAKDTAFFTIDETGEKTLEHLVKPKQTLFSLTRFYGLSLEELYTFNPEFRAEPSLKIGQIVRIPLPNTAILRYKTKGFDAKKYAPLVYRVRPKETLFNLCKRQFKMPVDSIMKRNRLKTTDLRPGQLILMGWISTDGIRAEDRGGKPSADSALKTVFETDKKAAKPQTGHGTAFFQKDSNEKGDLYVLHRTARIGSIMQIMNAATNKTVHAKVIGRIPDSYEDNTEIIVSPAAAKAVKALDSRFLVQIKFFE